MAHKQRQPKYTHTFIDSCAFNPGDPEEKCSRRLLEMHKKGKVNLEVAHSVLKEIDHPNTPQDVKNLARLLNYTCEVDLIEDQRIRQREIRNLIIGNAKKQNHISDADHIFDLYRNGGGYFVTTDRRLLGLSRQLFNEYFVTTITPYEYEKVLNESIALS